MWPKALEIYTPFVCGKWYLFHDKNEKSGNSGARVIKAYLACNIHFQLFQMKGEEFVENFGLIHIKIFQNVLWTLNPRFHEFCRLGCFSNMFSHSRLHFRSCTRIMWLTRFWPTLFILAILISYKLLFVPTRKPWIKLEITKEISKFAYFELFFYNNFFFSTSLVINWVDVTFFFSFLFFFGLSKWTLSFDPIRSVYVCVCIYIMLKNCKLIIWTKNHKIEHAKTPNLLSRKYSN